MLIYPSLIGACASQLHKEFVAVPGTLKDFLNTKSELIEPVLPQVARLFLSQYTVRDAPALGT